MSSRKPWRKLLGIALACNPLWAAAHGAHEHGVIKLDIAIDATRITVQMESPLDNFIGFEHAPRNAAERQSAETAVQGLKAAETLFKIDPAAGCALAHVDLSSAALKLGKTEPGAAEDGHADLDGDFEFGCKDATRAAFIDVGLFDAFTRIQRIDVQVAASKAQLKRTLKRPAARITLTR